MKTYRIRYTISDHENQYVNDALCYTDAMSDEYAAQWLADFWAGTAHQDDVQAFKNGLLEEGCAFTPYDARVVANLTWEAVRPIIVQVRGGVVQQVSNIPEDHCIEVHDWDGEHVDPDGNPVPVIAVWDASDPADA